MGFLGIGAMEFVVIIVIALLIFGPGRLPEIMGDAGRMLREFRNATRDLTGEFEDSYREVRQTYTEIESDMRRTARDIQKESRGIAESVNKSVTDATTFSNPLDNTSSKKVTPPKLDQAAVQETADDEVVSYTPSTGKAHAEEAKSSTAQSAASPRQPNPNPTNVPATDDLLSDDLLAAEDHDEDLLALDGSPEPQRSEPN